MPSRVTLMNVGHHQISFQHFLPCGDARAKRLVCLSYSSRITSRAAVTNIARALQQVTLRAAVAIVIDDHHDDRERGPPSPHPQICASRLPLS
jgi:hypothetical protein